MCMITGCSALKSDKIVKNSATNNSKNYQQLIISLIGIGITVVSIVKLIYPSQKQGKTVPVFVKPIQLSPPRKGVAKEVHINKE